MASTHTVGATLFYCFAAFLEQLLLEVENHVVCHLLEVVLKVPATLGAGAVVVYLKAI